MGDVNAARASPIVFPVRLIGARVGGQHHARLPCAVAVLAAHTELRITIRAATVRVGGAVCGGLRRNNKCGARIGSARSSNEFLNTPYAVARHVHAVGVGLSKKDATTACTAGIVWRDGRPTGHFGARLLRGNGAVDATTVGDVNAARASPIVFPVRLIFAESWREAPGRADEATR